VARPSCAFRSAISRWSAARSISAQRHHRADDQYAADPRLCRRRGIPPIGERAGTASRDAAGIADLGISHDASDSIVTLARTRRAALTNIDAIAATPGIDGLFLGPSDLSIALSDGRSLDPESQAVDAELDRIVVAANKPARYRAPFAPRQRARWRSPNAACASARSEVTWGFCAPARAPSLIA
jgi:hypothetical protein